MKKSVLIALVVVMVLVATASLVWADPGTVYVATTGTDGPTCGTVASPCQTIQYAIDNRAVPYDTIEVAAGTYNEQVTVGKDNLVIQSTAGPATTIIVPTDTTAGGIWIQGSGNTFQGFTVRDFADDTHENKIIRVHSGADDNVIRNNVIKGNLNQAVTYHTEYGILVYGSGTQIEYNEIFDIGYTGVNVVGPVHEGGTGSTIANNEIHDVGIYAITIDRSAGNTITGNDLYNLVGGTLGLWDEVYDYDPALWCWGIIIWGAAADGNHITDQEVTGLPNGVGLSSAHNTLVDQCNISGNSYTGLKIAVSSWAGGVPTGNQIIGNAIQNNGVDTGILVGDGAAVGNEAHCNIIVGNDIGVENEDPDDPFDAEYNWWGCDEGPGNPGCDAVVGNVDYDPWLLMGCLSVTKSVEPSEGMPIYDDEATFTIVASNNCVCPMPGALLTDLVDDRLTILEATSTKGTPVVDGQLVTLGPDTLGSSETFTVTIGVRVEGEGEIEDMACLTTAYPGMEVCSNIVLLRGIAFVPEASTMILLGSGLAGLAGYASLRLRAWRKREE